MAKLLKGWKEEMSLERESLRDGSKNAEGDSLCNLILL